MKKWIVALILMATLDTVTTYFVLSLGGVEANLLFVNMDIRMMALTKVGACFVAICLCVKFKLKSMLILVTGANMGAALGNLMTLWTQRG